MPTDDFFAAETPVVAAAHAPLAERMRPRSLQEYVGQEHILGPGKLLRRAIEADRFSSIVLYGPPGTGKTTFIRGLLSHSNLSAIVTYDAGILEKDALFARFIEDDANIMVLEDSDNFLKARSDGNTMMHRFLNVGDGLVTTKGKKLIFSTNLPSIRDVDSALVRPGRCFDILNFDTLKHSEAETLANRLGVKLDGVRDKWSIAEVFNKQIEQNVAKKVGTKMGFV